ncbi:EIN3-binding F-box protein 2-like [Gossypium raimondii]|uniref:EIN3-binding F-box protein 2-like n=1 Tax=Gossypium raimondii TaxID=29730 RepID=UPI00063AE1E8|nr:EIN3-binding F-box protein 2-like [Gossypium raimondii]
MRGLCSKGIREKEEEEYEKIKLSIRGSSSLRGGAVVVARGCLSLKVLSLWNVPRVGDKGLCEIAEERLIAIVANCHNLTVLSIKSCPKIGNEGLQAIKKLCPKLQSISINDCPLIGDHGVSRLLSSASFVFSKVKLHGLSIANFSLAVIGHYGKFVTNLMLSGLQNVSKNGFWVMGVTNVSLEAIEKECVNLKQMCLRKCCFVSSDGFVAFAKFVGSLKCLQLEECNRDTQSRVTGVLSNQNPCCP